MMAFEWIFPMVLVALLCDWFVGDPRWLYRRIPHPVILAGGAIDWLDRTLNVFSHSFTRRRLAGLLALLLFLAGGAGIGFALNALFSLLPFGWIAEGLLASSLLAQKSLLDHVAAVSSGLQRDLAGGRSAVARIVGRNPECLDEAGVGRAALESLAENYSDGVIAPLFWGLLLGLPGLLLYKLVNTADSMIGYKSTRHRAFGWAVARFDDLVNLVPARLSALILIAVAWTFPDLDARAAWRVVRGDARKAISPNAGYPEAALAGALSVRLAGPRDYASGSVEAPWIGEGRSDVTVADIDRGLQLIRRACQLSITVIAIAAIALLLV